MTALLAALWLLVGSSVTVMPMDTLPDGWTNEYGQMVLRDGRVLNSALGCHGTDDIRYYQRTRAMHLADVKREQPWIGFRSQLRIAHQRFVETEAHELAHALSCHETSSLDGDMGQYGRYIRPATFVEAREVWPAASAYCFSNDEEWNACMVAEFGMPR